MIRQLYYFVDGERSLEDFRVNLAGPLAHAFPTDPIVTPCAAVYGPGRELGREPAAGTVYHLGDVDALPYPLVWSGPFEPGGYWIGWCRRARPGPEDLVRDVRLSLAYPVTLLDGKVWVCPVLTPCRLRDEARASGLPAVRVHRGGRQVRVVTHEFADVAALGERYAARVQADESIDGDELTELAAAALGVVYRVGVNELLALELVDDAELELLAWAALDFVETQLARHAAEFPEKVAKLEAHGIVTPELFRFWMQEVRCGAEAET